MSRGDGQRSRAEKWRVSVSLEQKLRWDDAVWDTGSHYIIFPGICPVPESPDARTPESLTIRIPSQAGEDETTLHLPCRGITRNALGGVEGAKKHRYEFWPDFRIDGIDLPDLVPVLFMDIEYPIIGVAPIADCGYWMLFTQRRVWPIRTLRYWRLRLGGFA